MKLRTFRFLHGALIALIYSGCYADPSTDTFVEINREQHDELFREAAIELTEYTSVEIDNAISTWIVRLSDRVLYHSDHRAYFDVGIPGFRAWGQADPRVKVITLADWDFKSGVLAHEFGHALSKDNFNDHEKFKTNGIDEVTRRIQETFVVNASGEYDHPSLGCALPLVLTGASGESP